MKSLFGGFFLFSVIIWSLWALSAKTDCDKVHRFASPINLVSWGIRELSENWIDKETRMDILVWSIDAKEFAEKIIARTFYSKELTCEWGKDLHDE